MEKLRVISEPQFHHLQNGENNTAKELRFFDEVVCINGLAQYLALSGYFLNASQHPFLETSTIKLCFGSKFAGLFPVLDSKLLNNRHYNLFTWDSLELCTAALNPADAYVH